MADIVNLRTIRKQRKRDEAARDAQANRARFGRTKAEKAVTDASAERTEKILDGHRRDPPERT